MQSLQPHLDSPVQGGTGKGVSVLGVERDLHDIVAVPLKHLGAAPALQGQFGSARRCLDRHHTGLQLCCNSPRSVCKVLVPMAAMTQPAKEAAHAAWHGWWKAAQGGQ